MVGVLIFGYPGSELMATAHATVSLLSSLNQPVPCPHERTDVKMINYVLLRQKKIDWRTFLHDSSIGGKRFDFTATIDNIIHGWNQSAAPMVIADPILGIVPTEWVHSLRRRGMGALCILALRSPWQVAAHDLNSWIEYHRLAHNSVTRVGCHTHVMHHNRRGLSSQWDQIERLHRHLHNHGMKSRLRDFPPYNVTEDVPVPLDRSRVACIWNRMLRHHFFRRPSC